MLVANIFLTPLRELAPSITETLAKCTQGILSGIRYEQTNTLSRFLEEAGLSAIRRGYWED